MYGPVPILFSLRFLHVVVVTKTCKTHGKHKFFYVYKINYGTVLNHNLVSTLKANASFDTHRVKEQVIVNVIGRILVSVCRGKIRKK